MRRLDKPNISAENTIRLCITGIKESDFKNRVSDAYDQLSQEATSYENLGEEGELFTLQALPDNTDDNTIVFANLTKKELINLYENYFRNNTKPSRNIYDQLKLAAKDKCPYCGGIGRPRNLDHYLPKTYFPQFSIMPLNLIPSCRDCNMEDKGTTFVSMANEQIIHPYLDKDHFFNEKWIYARVIHGDPCSIKYFVCTPEHWSSNDRDRVTTHFNKFKLSERYAIQAAEELSTITGQRKVYPIKDMSPEDFREHLAATAKTQHFTNHWKKVLYQCLAEDEWFSGYTF